MHLTIRQAKGHIMLVYLYTYFLNGTQLNVRVHVCDCGEEADYHPKARYNAPIIEDEVTRGIRNIRMIDGIIYAKYDDSELFVIIKSDIEWSTVETAVLRIMQGVVDIRYVREFEQSLTQLRAQEPPDSRVITDPMKPLRYEISPYGHRDFRDYHHPYDRPIG